jgi:undecaprenyl-diphosphatase
MLESERGGIMNTLAGYVRISDVSLLYFINRALRCSVLDLVMRIVTHLGSLPFVVGLFLILMISGDEKSKAVAVSLGLTLTGSQVLVQALKRLVHRPRPYRALERVVPIDPPTCQYSFPSGHTSAAFSSALVLAGALPSWAAVYFGLATLVAISRVYLGVHYPSDCLAGFSITYLVWFVSIGLV